MKAQEFTAWAEAVYGKYTPAMKVEVEKFFAEDDWNDEDIAFLRKVVLIQHPSVYKVPPGVHEIDEMADEVGRLRRVESDRKLLEEKGPDALWNEEQIRKYGARAMLRNP